MKKYFLLLIISLLTLPIAGCGNGDKKAGVAIALADSTAGLIAWSDAVLVLIDLDEIDAGAAKGQFALNDKIRVGVKQIREKLETGFASKEILDIASELIDEAVKAQDNGLLGIKSESGKLGTPYGIFEVIAALKVNNSRSVQG